jgi:hypothetical protein
MATPRSVLQPRLCALVLLLWAHGCGDGGSDRTPAETVRQFLEAMDRSAADSSGLAEAYAMLDSVARNELEARAERASSLAGAEYEPWRMLAQGRFRRRFTPVTRGGMKAKVEGDTALVVVQGERTDQRAEIPLVREGGSWRIKLVIPPMDR